MGGKGVAEGWAQAVAGLISLDEDTVGILEAVGELGSWRSVKLWLRNVSGAVATHGCLCMRRA